MLLNAHDEESVKSFIRDNIPNLFHSIALNLFLSYAQRIHISYLTNSPLYSPTIDRSVIFTYIEHMSR